MIIKERNMRIDIIKNKLNIIILNRLKSFVLNLEEACAAKKKLKDLFPDCKKPIFIS